MGERKREEREGGRIIKGCQPRGERGREAGLSKDGEG